MFDNEISLPPYPCREDIWDKLSVQNRPVVVYGMGNGADKLINRLSRYGVVVADFFASDGFVRGHSFHGKRVKTLSEIEAEYSDFIILLSFATGRKEVLDFICEIDGKYEFYIPDMPVAGEDEYFDKTFYNENYDKIKNAYALLEDEESRKIFASVINYKLTAKLSYLVSVYTEKKDVYSLIASQKIETLADCGAYNGDTVLEALEYFPYLKKVYAFEPDKKTFKRLLKNTESISDKIEINNYNLGLWKSDTDGEFIGSGNRNSSVSSTASFEHRIDHVVLKRLDSVCCGKIDYIKYDVEGAELEALEGSEKTIERCAPVLLVSVYHRSRDIFYLINYLSGKYPRYKFFLRRTLCVPAWELNLIMIPNNKN